MCGITGFWAFHPLEKEASMRFIQHMTDPLISRGPDSSGYWCDTDMGLAFGHRRLKIVDLSSAGHQPMLSRSGRYVLSYNGELYNAKELRRYLETYGSFRGTSDTEVLVEAIAFWGIQEACHRFLGMFAFSLWDHHTRTLFLVRDRLGVKPLYWGFSKDTLFFGSQLKSFSGYPGFDPALDQTAVHSFFQYGYVPSPLSILKDIQKVRPGTIISITPEKQVQETCFWDPAALSTQKRQEAPDVLIEELDTLLTDAVRRRMISDVPIGAFLSGGIDSSLVVAMMQKVSPNPIQTFSIGFRDKAYDESVYAKAVAQHLGTEHHTLYVNDQEALDAVEHLPEFYDEPFADSSQIPTYLMSKYARALVTVSLSGDGGDEVFAGYNRYLLYQKLLPWLTNTPQWVKNLGIKALDHVPQPLWSVLSRCCPRYAAKIRSAGRFCLMSPHSFYKALVTLWPDPPLLDSFQIPDHPLFDMLDHPNNSVLESLQLIDFMTYLPDDILTKVDRASMAVGLEVRGPFLDHRITEWAWRLPLDMRIRKGKSKWILRCLLDRYIPASLIERPKMGFGVPLARWLKGPLKAWAQDLLSDAGNQNMFHALTLQKTWKDFLDGKDPAEHKLWAVLMFQSWKNLYRR